MQKRLTLQICTRSPLGSLRHLLRSFCLPFQFPARLLWRLVMAMARFGISSLPSSQHSLLLLLLVTCGAAVPREGEWNTVSFGNASAPVPVAAAAAAHIRGGER